MSLTGKTPFKLYRPLALNASGDGVAVTTLSGNLTMTALNEQLQMLDGGASDRDVALPTAEPELKGVFYILCNNGATNTLAVKDVSTTLTTLQPGDQGVYACTGSAWKVLVRTKTRIGSSGFASTEKTGTGSEQSTAHGLGSTPGLVWHALSELPADLVSGADVAYGTHDATNIKTTVTSGVKYYVFAIK